MNGLGKRLAREIKTQRSLERQFGSYDIEYSNYLVFQPVIINVSWSISTRNPSLTFLVGDDTKSKLGETPVGKAPWVEVGSG